MRSVDLNADLGEIPGREGAALDDSLIRHITSANVACGGHAGDDASMERVCRAAINAGVAIGAQVSYVDREGFGRRRLAIGPDQLERDLRQQVRALSDASAAAGGVVSYLKPHGALYHAAVNDSEIAAVLLTVAQGYSLPVLTLPIGHLCEMAHSMAWPVFAEAFADRGYDASGQLLPRDMPGAVIHDPFVVEARIEHWGRTGSIALRDSAGERPLLLEPASWCVHGDTPGAVDLARRIRATLESNGVVVQRFTGAP